MKAAIYNYYRPGGNKWYWKLLDESLCAGVTSQVKFGAVVTSRYHVSHKYLYGACRCPYCGLLSLFLMVKLFTDRSGCRHQNCAPDVGSEPSFWVDNLVAICDGLDLNITVFSFSSFSAYKQDKSWIKSCW